MGFFTKLKKAFKAVAAVAAVVVAIVAPELLPIIGNSILSAAGVTGASATVAAAAGSAALTTTGALINGASVGDALKAGAASGISAGVASGVGSASVDALGKTGAQIAGSAAGSAAGTVVAGGNTQDILRNAIAGGIASAASTYTDSKMVGGAVGGAISSKGDMTAAAMGAVAGAYSDYKNQAGAFDPSLTTPSEDTTPKTTDTTTPTTTDVAAAPTDTTTTPAQPTAPDTSAPADNVTITTQRDAPTGVVPFGTYTSTSGSYFPSSAKEVVITAQRPDKATDPYAQYNQTITDTRPSPSTEPLAKNAPAKETQPEESQDPRLGYSLYRNVSKNAPLAGALSAPFFPAAGATSGLTAYRGAGEIEGEQSGQPRESVWNEASLRLKDALGL
jgi:hypothetical protein